MRLLTLVQASPASITITVVDGGQPQASILVNFASENGRLSGHCLTSGNGNCQITDLYWPSPANG